MRTARRRELQRRDPLEFHPLDAVIRVAKVAESEDAEQEAEEAKAKAKEKLKAHVPTEPALAAEASASRKTVARKRSNLKQTEASGPEVPVDGQGGEQQQKPRYGNAKQFLSEVNMFSGRTVGGRRFPHDEDQSSIRRAEGASVRTAALNTHLRAGREARHNADLRLLRDCEHRWVEGRGRQSDGDHMRLGRVGQVSSWSHSGFLHQRGRVMTWHWQRSYWVLHDGLLWGFDASHLGARVRVVLPILGAKMGKTLPSSRAHPFSFTVTINPFFVEDELLATTEFAAPSVAERAVWIQMLNETAFHVSKMLRRGTALRGAEETQRL